MANVVGQNPVKYSYTRFRVFQPSFGGESGVFDDFGVGRVFKYSSIEILQSIWPYTQKPNGPLCAVPGKKIDKSIAPLHPSRRYLEVCCTSHFDSEFQSSPFRKRFSDVALLLAISLKCHRIFCYRQKDISSTDPVPQSLYLCTNSDLRLL
jgi:hypothetical protein